LGSPFLRPENMVHQTMAINKTMAPKASSNNNPMTWLLRSGCKVLIVGILASCANAPPLVDNGIGNRIGTSEVSATGAAPSPPLPSNPRPIVLPQSAPGDLAPLPDTALPLPANMLQRKSRWVAVPWSDLPGLPDDPLHEAWNAWLKSCEKPGPVFASLCGDVRRLSIGSDAEKMVWLRSRLQPYRVEPLQSDAQGQLAGLLTGYYEPEFEASRRPTARFNVPLYQIPLNLASRKPWFTRQEIDTLPQAQAALKGREIAYLADPVDALVLQIQGSGRVRMAQADGSLQTVRLAFAASNDQPYKSVGRWLIDQGVLKDASWPAIKEWTLQNPKRVQEMLWSNPRTVFFKEEPLAPSDLSIGPKGAQGVALTPGRSIAIDPGSIPYGTPVWMVSSGPLVNLQKLVLAQDTGSAITGAVRADYFAGWGTAAADLAGRLKQPLKLWVLWPK
jgi:membrane-bound lytic murein transglycosylase A